MICTAFRNVDGCHSARRKIPQVLELQKPKRKGRLLHSSSLHFKNLVPTSKKSRVIITKSKRLESYEP